MTNEEKLQTAIDAVNNSNYNLADTLAKEILAYCDTLDTFSGHEVEVDSRKMHAEHDNSLENLKLQCKATRILGIVQRSKGEYDQALEYYYKALALLDTLKDKSGMASVSGNIGNVYADLGSFDKALEYYSNALALHEALGEESGKASVIGNIGSVYFDLGSFDKALEHYSKALAMNQALGEKFTVASFTGNIGLVYYSQGTYDKALEYLGKALALHDALGAKSKVALVMGSIGSVHQILGSFDKALEYYGKALALHETLGEKSGAAQVMVNIGNLYGSKEFDGYDAGKAEEYLRKTIAICEEIGAKKNLYMSMKFLANLYEDKEAWKEFAVYYKKFHEIKEEVQSEEATKQSQLMEHRRKIEESERDRQVKLARFQEREKILDNILPSQITERLIKGENPIADKAENVSVFFSDIVGFTTLSQKMSAKELVSGLNALFIQYDILAKQHGLEKIKTIGDAYMAVCGVPVAVENHAERTANFAVGIRELFARGITIAGHNVQVRIGLHCGEVMAGVIGEQKFAYDLWGDAVNTAARMESHGEPGKIHVSEEFMHALVGTDRDPSSPIAISAMTGHDPSVPEKNAFHFIERGEMDIKGKGKMKTYFLEKTAPHDDSLG